MPPHRHKNAEIFPSACQCALHWHKTAKTLGRPPARCATLSAGGAVIGDCPYRWLSGYLMQGLPPFLLSIKIDSLVDRTQRGLWLRHLPTRAKLVVWHTRNQAAAQSFCAKREQPIVSCPSIRQATQSFCPRREQTMVQCHLIRQTA